MNDYRMSQLYRSGLVSFEHLSSTNPQMSQVLKEAQLAAGSDAPILIVGETGTGKNLLAQAIHTAGTRARKPFCEVNCGGVAESLQESELFGHRAGAFTGADKPRLGLIESAEGGTLFLNEIGDILLSTQKTLLDVIEYRKYRKLGSDTEVETDIRVIGATNKDLDGLRKSGEFRDDFYFRLSCFRLELPPLRQRSEDISALALRFLGEFSKRECRTVTEISPDALQELLSYSWPGNVRELRFVIWRSVLSTQGEQIEGEHVLAAMGRQKSEEGAPPLDSLEDIERRYVLRVLTHTNWHKSRTAEILRISRPALDRKIHAFGLSRGEP